MVAPLYHAKKLLLQLQWPLSKTAQLFESHSYPKPLRYSAVDYYALTHVGCKYWTNQDFIAANRIEIHIFALHG